MRGTVRRLWQLKRNVDTMKEKNSRRFQQIKVRPDAPPRRQRSWLSPTTYGCYCIITTGQAVPAGEGHQGSHLRQQRPRNAHQPAVLVPAAGHVQAGAEDDRDGQASEGQWATIIATSPGPQGAPERASGDSPGPSSRENTRLCCGSGSPPGRR